MSEREQDRPRTSEQPYGSGAGASAYPAPATVEQPAAQPGPAAPDFTAPQYSSRPVAFRRPDVLAGLLLVLAGVAAGVSLLLDWLADSDVTGMDLVRRGFEEFGDVFDTGLWQPLAVVLGGGVLLLLGLLALIPMRTHRALGAVALLVALVVGAAVLVPLVDEGWELDVFAAGFWFAVAVAVLGLLGALKALLTGPKYATR